MANTHAKDVASAVAVAPDAPPSDPTGDKNIAHAAEYANKLAGGDRLGYDEALLQQWAAQQESMKQECTFDNSEAWMGDPELKGLQRIGGLDISFAKGSAVDACATLVVLDYPSMKILHEESTMVQLSLPYIPGFLAFREVPLLAQLVEGMKATRPELLPQVLMLDGNGMLHPRYFGAACQLGVVTGLPAIGVAKTFLAADGIHMKDVKEKIKDPTTLPTAGTSFPLVGESGKTLGAAVRMTKDSVNPVFVSAGHRISLAAAVELVRRTAKFRVPEAVRQADFLSREYLRNRGML